MRTSSASPDLQYQSGFGNEFESEALPGALPQGKNNPKRCPYGLYAEQLSGTAFTVPRSTNQRSWLYRIKPSVVHDPFQPCTRPNSHLTASTSGCQLTPNQLRWAPRALPQAPDVDFVRSLCTVCCAGSVSAKDGYAIHTYAATASMDDCCLANADGDLLVVPQLGRLRVRTEFGALDVAPGEIFVVQRGIRFSVLLLDCSARGYALETFGGHFQLPDLGPIGANGLANPRDFLAPVAAFDAEERDFTVLHKLEGELFESRQDFSPFNVVAWHGNYAPYKYDLDKFCPMNAVGFDHADPSIFTVLTCPSALPGVALADFVVFPPRWSVAEDTFRPPYFHRNVMNEYMGLVRGVYEAKQEGFEPGGGSLHLCMTPHGPDATTFEMAVDEARSSGPQRVQESTLAFMFEVNATPRVTPAALASPCLDRDYHLCWRGLRSHFTGTANGELQRKVNGAA